MELKITEATVVRNRNYADALYLKTELPSGIWPFNGMQSFKTELAAGTADNYVRRHFPGLPLEIINVQDDGSWAGEPMLRNIVMLCLFCCACASGRDHLLHPAFGQFSYDGPSATAPWVQPVPISFDRPLPSKKQSWFDRPVHGVMWIHNPLSFPVRVDVACLHSWANATPDGICLGARKTLPLPIVALAGERFGRVCQVLSWARADGCDR